MQDLDISNIHLLLVEDNPDYLELLIEELEYFGYQHIETATDPDKAKEKLNQHFFEIIIADMRLAGDSGGGFVVFDEIQKRNITAVVIILTANDTVKDCRHAFKLGAGDYISKNMPGNVFEILHDSIKEAIAYLNRWGNRKDEMWIKENKAALLAQYHNQYIAVINHQVIEFAETEEVLKARIRERKLPLFLLVIQKIETETPQPPSITNLLQQEESDTLEFKSTLQWDVKKKQNNPNLRFEVLKTIDAFLNSKGGTLLIGVEDDGTIFGLKRDISLLGKRQTLDGFEQRLIGFISDHIGKVFTSFIKVRFEDIDEKPVCAVDVNRASEQAFMNGARGKEFYIRAGCTSRSLDIEEAARYIRMNWK